MPLGSTGVLGIVCTQSPQQQDTQQEQGYHSPRPGDCPGGQMSRPEPRESNGTGKAQGCVSPLSILSPRAPSPKFNQYRPTHTLLDTVVVPGHPFLPPLLPQVPSSSVTELRGCVSVFPHATIRAVS